MDEAMMKQELELPVSYSKNMTPEIARRVEELKLSIDVHDSGKVIAYGREEQAQFGNFYDALLNGVGTREIGESGELLTKVIGDINGYQIDCENENNGILSFLKKQKSKLKNLQTKYKSVADNVNTVVGELQKKDLELGEVSRNFETMYKANHALYEFLTMIIFAGEQKLVEEKEKLHTLQQQAEASGDMMEMQKASDFNDNIIRFERRLYDLKLTRTLAIQQAPQIRNVQKNAEQLSESIKTTIATSIPLWKSQMAMAVGMQAIKEGLNAINAVKDATNAMLIANSQMNKQLSLETAKAVERGVVDIETIKTVNQNLIDSLSGTYEIAQKAITERQEGEQQLKDSEAQLKNAIMQYSNLN